MFHIEKTRPNRPFFILTAILLVVFFFSFLLHQFDFIPKVNYDDNKHVEQPAVEFESNCSRIAPKSSILTRYVFFDLGANNGDSLANFFGLRKSAAGGDVRSLLPSCYIEQNKWIVYAYEANPRFGQNLADLRPKIPGKHQVHIHNGTAAWTYDGEIEFYLDLVYDDAAGSTLKRENERVRKSNFTKVKVPCHDIARLLSQFNEDDVVIMKMDIEGAEFDLFFDFIKKNVLRLIDYFAIEYHPFANSLNSTESVFERIMKDHGVKKLNWT